MSRICESFTYMWVMSRTCKSCHVYVSHVTYSESCHVCMSLVSYEWVISRICESRHVYMSHVTYTWVMSRTYKPCHIYMRHVTNIWVICPIWLSHVRYWDRNSCIETAYPLLKLMLCVTSRIQWVMSHMNASCQIWMSHVTYEWVMSHKTETVAESLLRLM